MSEISKIRVGISVGDPNGIGFEIILKTFEDRRIFDFFTPVVFAHSKNFIEERKKLGITTSVFKLKNLKKPNKGQLNVVDVWNTAFPVDYGKEQLEAGVHAISSLESATRALKNGVVDVLVTAPIHKKSIQSNTFKFPGHTDYLNENLKGESLMFMVTDNLKVALMSDHIPLKEVVGYLNEEKINTKIALLEKSLIQDFGIQRPKIAVLGINPHSGDNGVIGDEDDTLLTPVIKKWTKKGSLVFGPYAADGFFGNQSYTKFDGILAAYHDQGLIPFKTLSFGQGVNFTAGLSHVRTSPDHGTAFDIAGKGVADSSSFREAIYTARAIYLNRQQEKKKGN